MNDFKHLILFVFFTATLISGIIQTPQYGIYPDDGVNRSFGHYEGAQIPFFFTTLLSGVAIPVSDLECSPFTCQYIRDVHAPGHTPFLEILLSIPEKVFSLADPYSIATGRHIGLFLFFFMSLIFFYKLCMLVFEDWKLSLFACILLLASPRIFADMHYNTTDIGALSAFIFATYAFLRYCKDPSWKTLLRSSLITAIAIDIRATSIVFIPLTIAYACKEIYISKSVRPCLSKKILQLFVYLMSTSLFIILFWPQLWNDPLSLLSSLKTTFGFFHFPVGNLYNGTHISSEDIPWHYNIVWIGITTPLLYLAFFFLGCLKMLRDVLKRWISKDFTIKPFEATAFCWFFLPIISAIILEKAFYNGWRHFYFIYPALIMLSTIGFKSLKDFLGKVSPLLKKTFLAAVLLCVASITFNMIRIHPYEYAYFNALAPKTGSRCDGFDKDYFDLSTKQQLEYLLLKNGEVNVAFKLDNQKISLPPEKKAHINVTDLAHADYFINSDYMNGCGPNPAGEVIHPIDISGSIISEIVKLH